MCFRKPLEIDKTEDTEMSKNILSFENNEWLIPKISSVPRIQYILLVSGFIFVKLAWFFLILTQLQNKQSIDAIGIEEALLRKFYFQTVTKDGQVYLRDIGKLSHIYQPFKLLPNPTFQYFYEYKGKLHAIHYIENKIKHDPHLTYKAHFTYLTYMENGEPYLAKKHYYYNRLEDQVINTYIPTYMVQILSMLPKYISTHQKY